MDYENIKINTDRDDVESDGIIFNVMNKKMRNVRDSILLGELFFKHNKKTKCDDRITNKKENSIYPDDQPSNIDNQIIKNMIKSHKINLTKSEKLKLVHLINLGRKYSTIKC